MWTVQSESDLPRLDRVSAGAPGRVVTGRLRDFRRVGQVCGHVCVQISDTGVGLE